MELSYEGLCERVRRYRRDCREQGRSMTAPGLCLAVDVTPEELVSLVEDPPRGLEKHARRLRRALLEMSDQLERRGDAMAKFLLRQRVYGGYSENPPPAPVKVRLLLE